MSELEMTSAQAAATERQFSAITKAIGDMLWDTSLPMKYRAITRNSIMTAIRLHALGAGLPPEDDGDEPSEAE